MTDKPITIDADTARRMTLNAERNPRETNYGESDLGVFSIDPFTGRPYADGEFITESESKGFERLLRFEHEDRRNETYHYPGKWHDVRDMETPKFHKPRTNQEIELQKALGRMEVREGKLHDFVFGEFLDDLERLADLYSQPSFTLESITDPNGLNAAIGPFANERVLREIKLRDPIYNKDLKYVLVPYKFSAKIMDGPNINKK